MEDLVDCPNRVEERVDAYEGYDYPVYGAFRCCGEDSLELHKDRELEEDNRGAVEDVADVLSEAEAGDCFCC